MSTRRRHPIGLGHPRRLGRYLAVMVVGLQLVVIGTFFADPASDPIDLPLFQLLWAWMHKPSFYPLVALLIAGPLLTLICLRIRGPHRPALLLAWVVFGGVVYWLFWDRTLLKLEILWMQYGW